MNLRTEDLHFSYTDKEVLTGVSIALEGTEIVSVVGPNGSGKSTLVKCIDGLLKPKSGRVFLDERDIADFSIREIAEDIGYVPQSTNLIFSSTVFDTVMMGRRPHASWSSSEEDVDIVLDVLVQLELEEIALRDFNELSGGQQQRVLIARALAQNPGILLLDEPTSALDIAHQLEVMELVHELAHEKQMAVLMVVHDLNLTSRYSDKVVMLNHGAVHAVGSAEEIFTEENIRQVYNVEAIIDNRRGQLFIVPIRRVEETTAPVLSV